MKNIRQQRPEQNPRFESHKKRAENKDNLDHREGEEQLTKGDDVTHNRRQKKSGKSYQDRKQEKGRQ